MLTYVPGTSRVQAVGEYLRDRDSILRDLLHNLQIACNRVKVQAYQHHREVNFSVRDFMYLKLQPYRQASVALRSSLKLAPHFVRQFQITAKMGPVAYKLALLAGSKIHDVFHVSMLKKHLGPASTSVGPRGPSSPA
ncbi:hypothetical protein Dsin_002378 [Dipteronia sinensis]|uniref:Tf2-1-like SH3-like domain-containing protein n=1 Tax=Dipteronia sinensis TaxID=43782 RepID=A0AAE0EJX3_9ROSI|nr:hypothetical protein Dsin_002378 [Dipteronia sinensis]